MLNPTRSRSVVRRLMNGAGWEKGNRAAVSRPKDNLRCEHAVHRKIDTSTDVLTVTGNLDLATLNLKP